MAYAFTVLVPERSFTTCVQLVKLLVVVVTIFHALLFSRYQTPDIPQLSLFVPAMVAKAFVICCFEVGAVIKRVGRLVSLNAACNVKFDCIRNCRFVPVTVTPPAQFVETCQLVNTKPVAGAEVML